MNLLSKLNRAPDIGGAEMQACQVETTLLEGLKQQREATQQKLAKLDEAIVALEGNPGVADVLQKLSKL